MAPRPHGADQLEAQLATLELDLLELEVDIAAGLVPAWARRGLLPHERTAGINYALLDAAIDSHASTIIGALRHHRTTIADELERQANATASPAELVALVNRVADPARPITADVRGYARRTADLEALIRTELTDAYRAGITSARLEADAQGVPTVALDQLLAQLDAAPDPAIAAQAAASSSAPARAVTEAVAKAGARFPLATLDLADARSKVVDAARNDLAAGLDTDAARTPVQQTHAQARTAAQEALPAAARWYASELLDRNTCGPCSLVDGVEYRTHAEALEDYPAGLYRGCQGGARCRGTIVIVWDTEARPTNDDVAPTPRPDLPPPDATPPAPPSDPTPPGPTSAARKGKKLTAAERDAALADLAAESEFTVEELKAASVRLEELRKAARAEAAGTQDAARYWLTGGPSPIYGTNGPGVTALKRPPRARRITDPRTGRKKWTRTDPDGNPTADYDWLETLDPAELVRLQKHGWLSDDGVSVDQLHAQSNGGLIGRVAGAADSELLTSDEAVDAWITHTSLTDAAGSVAQGRPFGSGHRVSYAEICPELEGEGWDVGTIIAARPSEFDADAILHVARHDALDAVDNAERELLDEWRLRTGNGTGSRPQYDDAPAPWAVSTDSYRGELIDLEYRIRADEFSPGGPSAADLDRWNELVPIADVDADGNPLSYEDLHHRIVDLANRAGMDGARPLAELNSLEDPAARQAAEELAQAEREEAERAAREELRRQAQERAELERRQLEEERARQAAEAARRQAEEEARRVAEEQAAAEARRQAEEARFAEEQREAARRLEAANRARVDEELRRRAAEANARRRAEASIITPLDPTVTVLDPKMPAAGRAMVEDTLGRLGELTGVADDSFQQSTKPLEVIYKRGKRGQRKGGHYSPRSASAAKPRRKRGEPAADYNLRVRAYNAAPRRPEILVYDVPDGGIPARQALLHEFGHRADTAGEAGVWHTGKRNVVSRVNDIRLDRRRDVEVTDVAATAAAEDLVDVEDALVGFLSKAWEQPVIRDAHLILKGDPAFVTYHRDPREIWARFYNQWAARELGPDTAAEHAGMLAYQPALGFTDAEYDAMLPHFLAAMRARGLLTV